MEPENGQLQTETGQEAPQGVLEILGINYQLLGLQLFNFALVMIIVWFLIMKPLSKKLNERKEIIDRSLDKAKEVETNLKMSERKFEETLADAKKQANEIIENAKVEADKLAERTKKTAMDEVNKLVAQAKSQIAAEKKGMVAEIKSEAVELVMAVTTKILGEKLDSKKDSALIEAAIKDVEKKA